MNWDCIITEARNEHTENIDRVPTDEILRLINDEDKKVAYAVEKEIPNIAKAVDIIAQRLKQGGRLVYCGCGTSGRIGVLDAVECEPTFSVLPGQVIGLMAGGNDAIFRAKEGAEDDLAQGEEDLRRIDFCEKDVLVGIAASGRTPYVIGAMRYAKNIGAKVCCVCCCKGSQMEELADVAITPIPGPEAIAGSTRMKSGTAQKMVLNMLSTGSMIRLGKVYKNLMVDVKPSNNKLIHRSVRIVSEAADVDEATARSALEKCNFRPKTAIIMILKNLDCESANSLLSLCDGNVSAALNT